MANNLDNKLSNHLKAPNIKPTKVNKTYNDYELRMSFGIVTRLLGIFAMALLLVGIYRLSQGGKMPLFSDLLYLANNSPTFQIPLLGTAFSNWVSSANLGIFAFVKPVASLLGSAVDMVLFLMNGMLAIYQYLFFFIRWIFAF